MDWITVIGLITIGVILIVVEIIFIPGTTVVGIGGFLFAIVGVFFGYKYFGNTTGNIILVSATVVTVVVTILSFRSNSWDRFSLKEQNTGKFNDDFKMALTIGTEGLTISSLKPVGKAIFNDQIMEVKSNGNFITENQKVKVIKTESNKIIVEPI